MSVLVHPPTRLHRPGFWAAWAAVGVAELVAELSRREAVIKWPNDVLVDGRKICGVLIESGICPGQQGRRSGETGTHSNERAILSVDNGSCLVESGLCPDEGESDADADAGRGTTYVIVGIGLNVLQTGDELKALGLDQATSLALITGRPWTPAEVAEHLVGRLDRLYSEALADGGTALEAAWARRLNLLGASVAVETMSGDRVVGWLRRVSFDAVVLEIAEGNSCRLRPELVRHLHQHGSPSRRSQ